MNLFYQSTRGGEERVTASQAILQGLSADGGLFMPVEIPRLLLTMEELGGMTYQETAYEVMKLFLTDFTREELTDCISRAYDDKFDTPVIAPLVKADGAYYLELFHGSTIAFKDMALSILPHLMITSAKKNHVEKEIVILTATSGDTGKAAMAGFSGVEGTRIIVFYPKDGVSRIQELQMVTQKGDNTSVVAIHGNFDDAQTGVKKLFSDQEFGEALGRKGFQLSSANSINIGRLVPQVVYYVYAYAKLLEREEIKHCEPINVTVPTGNFGNILAAYFAQQMGVPIGKLICASNDNKVLYDFFTTGTYDRNREFILTSSPSMDILISSNLERLIYLSTDCDGKKTAQLMADLDRKGSYTVTKDMRARMGYFVGGFATREEVAEAIRHLYEETGYVVDPHTGVAAAVNRAYQASGRDQNKALIASTASPYKFARSVLEAIKNEPLNQGEFEVIDELCRVSGVDIPQAVEEVRGAKILHSLECDVDGMKAMAAQLLGL